MPIGKPVTNAWAYILDKQGNQMPIGVPGEICISSDYISPGYYNNPEMTNEKFVDNPYSTCEDNKRMYRTGDIGFYNFNGEIEIMGREDDQLSVRGFRIESNEILNIMKGFDEIRDIYLDVDHDNLVAYYTTNADFDIMKVKKALKLELPDYMIPSLFIELEEMPLNANGKIDKFALKNIRETTEIHIVDDETLNIVLEAFREVLNNDFILIDSDFVEWGGNSLSAMNLQMLLNQNLGVSLSSSDIIELSTPVNIANHIKYNLESHLSNTVSYSFEDLCPLSESQLNVYLDETVKEMNTAYNNPFKIEFKNDYSFADIKKALSSLFDCFPILKARIINDNGILSFSFDAEPKIDKGLPSDLHSFVQPFNFDESLSRFLFVKNNDSSFLCIDIHHMIFDGTSLNILLNKLFSILNNEYDDDFIDNGVLRAISFEENISSDYMANAQEFFEEILADRDDAGELVDLSYDSSDFEFIDTFDIDQEYLDSFLQNNSITYNQFFSSVFAYTLSRFAGSEKVLFNLVENGRGHIDLSQSVGMFVRTLPVLLDCSNQDISSFLDVSSNVINSVMKYDLYPFRLLANAFDLNSNILFQYSHDLFSNLLDKEKFGYSVDELNHDLNAELSVFHI